MRKWPKTIRTMAIEVNCEKKIGGREFVRKTNSKL